MGRDVELIAHSPGRSGGESPFWRALVDVAESGPLDLACPYLSADLLRHLLARTRGELRVLTDVQAWLDSTDEHGAVLALLREHPDAFRDCRGLHAKLALGPRAALLGSANFTRRGLLEAHELGVRLVGTPILRELATWFEAAWSRLARPDLASAEAVASDRAERARPASGAASMPDTALALRRARVPWDTTSNTRARRRSASGAARDVELIGALRAEPADASELMARLDSVAELLDAIGVTATDERVALTLDAGRVRLNVGRRAVMTFNLRDPKVQVAAYEPAFRAMHRAFVGRFGPFSPQPAAGTGWIVWPAGVPSNPALFESRVRAAKEALGQVRERTNFRRAHDVALFALVRPGPTRERFLAELARC